MRILVTGGAGFIGSRLCGRLLDEGHEVTAVDDLSLGQEEFLAPLRANARFSFVKLDVNDPRFLALAQEKKPERLVHFAANSDIGAGGKDPNVDLQRTFLTTFNALEAARLSGCKELVLASTSAIYGDQDLKLTETHGPLEPCSLYGAAKLASEAYLSAFCRLFGMTAWVFRFPNVIGPNLTHGVVYDFVRRLLKDQTHLSVLGDGSQTKPYLHVDDLLAAIFAALKTTPAPVATFNVAGEGATSVKEIAELTRQLSGLPKAELRFGTGNRGWPGDVPRFAYDTAKVRALGWTPKWTSTEAVKLAIEAEVARCRRSSS